MFRAAFKRNRCLIPASAYYEWHDTAEGKQPYCFARADGSPLTIAGLWDEWHHKNASEAVQCCTKIITEPNAFIA
jgi:putative SOS response-associated peptidase YedK